MLITRAREGTTLSSVNASALEYKTFSEIHIIPDDIVLCTSRTGILPSSCVGRKKLKDPSDQPPGSLVAVGSKEDYQVTQSDLQTGSSYSSMPTLHCLGHSISCSNLRHSKAAANLLSQSERQARDDDPESGCARRPSYRKITQVGGMRCRETAQQLAESHLSHDPSTLWVAGYPSMSGLTVR